MNPLAKKLQIKPNSTWLFLNTPGNYLETLEPLPDGVVRSTDITGKPDGVQLFVKDSKDLAIALEQLYKVLKPDTILWICYPKRSAGIPTDLGMTNDWEATVKYHLRPVASSAINDAWTALRFKPIDQVKPSGVGKAEIKQNEYAEYVDVDNKTITLPPDILDALAQAPGTLDYYNSLAWSHKKEYAIWVLSAKQEKTRATRIEKMVEMLQAKKKNPTEK
ncbi:YdeI/OmpD-associated family protein [Mucilaginibacter sp. RS28]|uniref:YdeI/OmpD-associated family protein n=1 Tax=Mucilaginibacter straminoryzae TaxID=2932774 RepID=A0A9X2BBH5_9SPHI|nr:YdeI/OmpD-associated family protein [Mucilaginibacter straminoryzae]MCJ8209852.1 YdeI/OmpD-associated family protein [Mucilaginibacter straminoryzae]